MNPQEALEANRAKLMKDPKAAAQMNRDLGWFLVEAGDKSATLTANVAYRSGWVAGNLAARGTPLTADPEEDDGTDEAPDHPASPAAAREMGVG